MTLLISSVLKKRRSYILVLVGFSVTIILHAWQHLNAPLAIRSSHTTPSRSVSKTDVNMFLGVRHPQVIFYNRIPRTGSTYTSSLLRNICRRKGIAATIPHISQVKYPKPEDEEKIVQYFANSSTPNPMFSTNHLPFVNFTRYGSEMPEMINLIREPLKQWVSVYYFQRGPPSERGMIDKRLLMTDFNKCVTMGHPDCLEKCKKSCFWNILTYFCGFHKACNQSNEESLSIAKQNVHQYYGVVGIYEDLSSFLELLKFTYPTFFDSPMEIERAKLSIKDNQHRKKRLKNEDIGHISTDIDGTNSTENSEDRRKHISEIFKHLLALGIKKATAIHILGAFKRMEVQRRHPLVSRSAKFIPTNHTLKAMKDVLKYDYEFYDWIKQRFNTHYAAMKAHQQNDTAGRSLPGRT